MITLTLLRDGGEGAKKKRNLPKEEGREGGEKRTHTFVNCGHLKKKFTAPWLKNLVEYSYLLPKYSVKILREKKWAFSFYFTFCKRGILHVSLWRVAL